MGSSTQGYVQFRRAIMEAFENKGADHLALGLFVDLCCSVSDQMGGRNRTFHGRTVPGGVWTGSVRDKLLRKGANDKRYWLQGDPGDHTGKVELYGLLRRLETKFNWIRKFPVGPDGMAIVINKFEVRDQDRKRHRINTDLMEERAWFNPAYVPLSASEISPDDDEFQEGYECDPREDPSIDTRTESGLSVVSSDTYVDLHIEDSKDSSKTNSKDVARVLQESPTQVLLESTTYVPLRKKERNTRRK